MTKSGRLELGDNILRIGLSSTTVTLTATNLFRKWCIEFYQNRPSFIEDIIKNILVFFSGHFA